MTGHSFGALGIRLTLARHHLAGQRPSAMEERGDRKLDEARNILREYEDNFDPSDWEIFQRGITTAREEKIGLDSKTGLWRYLRAREYLKSSRAVLKGVKTTSDRRRDIVFYQARDANLGHNSVIQLEGYDTVPTIQLLRGFVPHVDAAPLQATAQNPIPIDYEDTRTTGTSIRKQLGAEMKPTVTTLVENMYNFKTSQDHSSISYNARRAQELLKHMNFVYPEPRTSRDPYRHPIIQRAIDTTLFRNKDDIGVVAHEHFSSMLITIIALTLVVIECCIDEWSTGTRKDSSWDDAKFQTVYDSHVSSLLDIQAYSPASNSLLYQMQCDLLRNAREHAGVTADPITGSSSFPPGASDPMREENNQSSPTAPPSIIN